MAGKYFFLGFIFFLFGFRSASNSQNDSKSKDLIINKVSDHAYQHITYLQTQSFGRVSCNGMVVFDKNEAVIFDTPVNDSTSAELIDWVRDSLKCKVVAVIATHFHEDCVNGLDEFHKRKIPSYATNKTIKSAKERGFRVPQNGFDDSLVVKIGSRTAIAKFFGEGHTKDNVVGYFPGEKIMFGGCLIKEVGATKGNLADANVNDWPKTVTKLKRAYPDVKMIIPGHGESGGVALLDYTIKLFEAN